MAITTVAYHPEKHYNPTHMEHVKGRQFRWYNVIVVVIMSLGGTTIFGYTSSVIGMTLAQPTFIEYMGLDRRGDAADLAGLMVSLHQAGGFFGLIVSSYISDRWGRKFSIGTVGFVALIGGALTTGAVNITMFCVGRFVTGWAGWAALGIVPIWLSEIAAPAIRGTLNALNMSIMSVTGYIFAAATGYGLFHLPQSNNWSWRGPLIFQFLAPVVLFSALWFLPESPRWLMSRDRHSEAEVILNRLHQPEEARIESIQIQRAVRLERTVPSSWLSMITKKSYRKRTFLAIYVAFAGQMMGTLTLTQFNPTIYGLLGFSIDRVLQYTLGYIVFASGMLWVSQLMIDRIPRNIMMSIAFFGTSVFLSIVCALIAIYTKPEAIAHPNNAALKTVIGFVYLTSGFYQTFYEAVQFAYLGEIFPTQLRAKGVVLGVVVIALINIMWLQTAPIAFKNIGWRFFICFVIPSFCCGFITLFLVPDTRKMPLEEVNKLFGDYDEIREANIQVDKNNESISAPSEKDLGVVAREGDHVENII